MSLSVGIVGLPNVGKSTLFNALTRAGALAANYPFATIEANVGVAAIPDPRLGPLASMFGSIRVTPATVTFVDIAGLVRGASTGEGLGNQFLGRIREVDAICHVVRVFRDETVAHVVERVDPGHDIEVVQTELELADLATVEKQQGRTERDGDTAQLDLLASKPVIFVFNCDDEALADQELIHRLTGLVAPAEVLFIDAQVEAELAGLDPEERAELADAGHPESGLGAVIRAAHRTLGLQSFLTANRNEARAWTIPTGATAAQAAGEVHSDFERGFIAASAIGFDRLMKAGSWQAARAAGLIRTEGRSYVMRPDDVVEFRFNL